MLERASILRSYVRGLILPYIKAYEVMLSRLNTRLDGSGLSDGVNTHITSLPNLETVGSLTAVNGGQVGGFRNRIINGDMRVSQRLGASAAVVTGEASVYSLDRWRHTVDIGDAEIEIYQTDRDAPRQALTVDVTTHEEETAVDALLTIEQYVEANNIQDLMLGTADAQIVTLSFSVRGSTPGTYCGSLHNELNDRSFVFEYDLIAVDTEERKSITIHLDSAGTWEAGTNVGLVVRFTLAAGTDHHTEDTLSWEDDNATATDNQTNLTEIENGYIDFTDIQLEVGPAATAFERRPIGVELGMCQRYYQKSYPIDLPPGTNISNGAEAFVARTPVASTSDVILFDHSVRFISVMRTAPVVVLYAPAGDQYAIFNVSDADVITPAAVEMLSDRGFSAITVDDANTETIAADDNVAFHYTADADYV